MKLQLGQEQQKILRPREHIEGRLAESRGARKVLPRQPFKSEGSNSPHISPPLRKHSLEVYNMLENVFDTGHTVINQQSVF
jgi:hypothetical protein